jgi:hypothetical protein
MRAEAQSLKDAQKEMERELALLKAAHMEAHQAERKAWEVLTKIQPSLVAAQEKKDSARERKQKIETLLELGKSREIPSERMKKVQTSLASFRQEIEHLEKMAPFLDKCENFEDLKTNLSNTLIAKEEFDRLDSEIYRYAEVWKSEEARSSNPVQTADPEARKHRRPYLGTEKITLLTATYHSKNVLAAAQKQCDDSRYSSNDPVGSLKCEVTASATLSRDPSEGYTKAFKGTYLCPNGEVMAFLDEPVATGRAKVLVCFGQ